MKIMPGQCPTCLTINDEAIPIMGSGLTIGDYFICESCANPSIYIGGGQTRVLTEYERKESLDDEGLMVAISDAMEALMIR